MKNVAKLIPYLAVRNAARLTPYLAVRNEARPIPYLAILDKGQSYSILICSGWCIPEEGSGLG
jgi:hypothetical protein